MRTILNQNIPTSGVKTFITDLARQHDVTYVRDGNSALARVITDLSGDDVQPDETEKLIIALRRSKVVSGATMVILLGQYFDELRDIAAQHGLPSRTENQPRPDIP